MSKKNWWLLIPALTLVSGFTAATSVGLKMPRPFSMENGEEKPMPKWERDFHQKYEENVQYWRPKSGCKSSVKIRCV